MGSVIKTYNADPFISLKTYLEKESIMRKITALALLVTLISALMVPPPTTVSAKSKTSEIDNYISATFDVYNVPIVASTIEFQEGIDDKSIGPVITDDSRNRTLYTISAKGDGCLLIESSCCIDIYEDKSKKSRIYYYKQLRSQNK
jgi:hypothetical protein